MTVDELKMELSVLDPSLEVKLEISAAGDEGIPEVPLTRVDHITTGMGETYILLNDFPLP